MKAHTPSEILVEVEGNEQILQSRENSPERSEFAAAFRHLQDILNQHLADHPRLSINSLAQRCSVSEPTLRRIKNGQLKTLPSISTIMDLLTFLSGQSNTSEILKIYSGPVADFLREKIEFIDSIQDFEYSDTLAKSLRDPVKYMVFKLTCSDSGVRTDKVTELFGEYGKTQLNILTREGFVIDHGTHFKSTIEKFSLPNDMFVEHFKTVANFIKPNKHATAAKSHSPIFANFSNSIHKQAYAEILKVQRAATRRIGQILFDKSSSGEIPTFFLTAVDTIDSICADEFPND